MNSSLVTLGIALAVLSGLMNGTFTLPMRYLGKWSWENVWTVFVVVACLVMPVVIFFATVARPFAVLSAAPARAEWIAVGTGFAWGFGAVMFGQGVSALGISMGNTLVLAISASLGSFLPILILAPERLRQPQGEFIMLGTAVAMAGIACCGYAGLLRERSERNEQNAPREMVGTARPLWAGLLLCSGAGLLSALFNIGYSFSQGIITSAVRMGNGPFAARRQPGSAPALERVPGRGVSTAAGAGVSTLASTGGGSATGAGVSTAAAAAAAAGALADFFAAGFLVATLMASNFNLVATGNPIASGQCGEKVFPHWTGCVRKSSI